MLLSGDNLGRGTAKGLPKQSAKVIVIRKSGPGSGFCRGTLTLFQPSVGGVKPDVVNKFPQGDAHTFFEQMGQDFRYVSQHHLSNKARAIRFLSDGEPMLAIWNEDGNSLIPDEIKNCFTTKTTIYTINKAQELSCKNGKCVTIPPRIIR